MWKSTGWESFQYPLLIQRNSDLKAPKNAYEAAFNGAKFLSRLQTQDGHFAGMYGGPMFLIPGLAIVMYITKTPYPPGFQQEIIRYVCNRANKNDGGWGIHTEGDSTVFGTALNYAALRLLGLQADHPVCAKARNTLWRLGGAVGAPSWGKFWLSVLNVYEWEGNNSVPPELW
jgi:lanosterol synthase